MASRSGRFAGGSAGCGGGTLGQVLEVSNGFDDDDVLDDLAGAVWVDGAVDPVAATRLCTAAQAHLSGMAVNVARNYCPDRNWRDLAEDLWSEGQLAILEGARSWAAGDREIPFAAWVAPMLKGRMSGLAGARTDSFTTSAVDRRVRRVARTILDDGFTGSGSELAARVVDVVAAEIADNMMGPDRERRSGERVKRDGIVASARTVAERTTRSVMTLDGPDDGDRSQFEIADRDDHLQVASVLGDALDALGGELATQVWAAADDPDSVRGVAKREMRRKAVGQLRMPHRQWAALAIDALDRIEDAPVPVAVRPLDGPAGVPAVPFAVPAFLGAN